MGKKLTRRIFSGLFYACRRIKRSVEHFFLQILSNNMGKEVSLNGKITVVHAYNLSIGSNCSFNDGDYINAFNPVTIGDDVTISANVNIVSTGIDYKKWFQTGEKHHDDNEEITIGNHVWIGCNATILAGVHITGEYVVIAAGAVVTKDITESHCVVAGCPAKIIRREEQNK